MAQMQHASLVSRGKTKT